MHRPWLLAVALLLCEAALAATPRQPAGTILIVAGRSLQHGSTLASVLDTMAASCGAFGTSRFELLEGVEATDPALPDRLAGRDDLRVVVLVVGNLSLLRNVDPSLEMPADQRQLSSRVVDLEGLARSIEGVRRAAGRHGARVLLATAPLGLQGRIEVPELLEVAAWLRETESGLLDLGGHFASRERAMLFANGIDVLNVPGEHELARALLAAVLRDDALLPPTDDREAAHRAEQRLLDAWCRAERAFPQLMEAADAGDATSPGPQGTLGAPGDEPAVADEAVGRAALAMWRDDTGPATCARWQALARLPSAQGAIGLSAGCALCELEEQVGESTDALERELVNAGRLLSQGLRWDALVLAQKLVDDQPQRIEPWMLLIFIEMALGRPIEPLLDEARASVGAVSSLPLAESRVHELLAGLPDSMAALPLLLRALAPHGALLPTGPALEQARRYEAGGMLDHAIAALKQASRQHRLPPSWKLELARLRALNQR